MPTTELEEADLTDGVIDLISLLVKAELAPTRSEARRNIEQGGVTVDGEKVSDVKATFTKDALMVWHERKKEKIQESSFKNKLRIFTYNKI